MSLHQKHGHSYYISLRSNYLWFTTPFSIFKHTVNVFIYISWQVIFKPIWVISYIIAYRLPILLWYNDVPNQPLLNALNIQLPSDSSLIISNLSLRAVIISLWISSISDQLDSVKTSSISISSRISSFDLYLKGLIELSTVEFLINLFGELDLSLKTIASLDFLFSLDCDICLFFYFQTSLCCHQVYYLASFFYFDVWFLLSLITSLMKKIKIAFYLSDYTFFF